jgi:hypothetical protein
MDKYKLIPDNARISGYMDGRLNNAPDIAFNEQKKR